MSVSVRVRFRVRVRVRVRVGVRARVVTLQKENKFVMRTIQNGQG